MKRRDLLAGAILAAGSPLMRRITPPELSCTLPESGKGREEAAGPLGPFTLPELRELYHRDLFADWLPFMDRHVIDPEYGGFLCNTDFDGTHVNSEKDPLFEGRGIWVYSYLYTHFGKDARHLEVARRSVELLGRSEPAEGAFWCTTIHRDGTPAGPPATLIPTDLGVAEGFAAYAQATGQQQFLDKAKRLLAKCLQVYDRSDYNPGVGRTYFGASAPEMPGARIMGSWMILLRTAAQILEIDSDPKLDALARRCADAIVHHHFNPEFQLNNELLNHDLSRPVNEYAQLSNLGNTLEVTWMLLDEATRQRDDAMFQLCSARLRRHAEVASDAVYGGVFHLLLNVDQNLYQLNKLLWAQEETLVDTLYIYRRCRASWAADMFGRMYAYVRQNYPLAPHGSPLWMYASDRKASFEGFSRLRKRVENYHHPRHLMLNLRRIDEMLGGRA
jgi:mannose/cellobiose epimerase-like protein (N-acyl-D-glucosamine 2-epimerase family)